MFPSPIRSEIPVLPVREAQTCRLLALVLLICVGSLTACADRMAPVPAGEVEDRDGVTYLVGSEDPLTGVVVEAFPDSVSGVAPGAVASETTYVGGVRDGERREYHSNGRLRRSGSFVAGVVQGVVREWSPDGILVSERAVVDGRPEGLTRTWYGDGARESEATYLAGALHGSLSRWYPNGELRLQREYRNGYPHGTTREWWEDGSPKVEGGYADGLASGPFRRWHENGQLAVEAEYFRGRSTEIRMWDGEGGELEVRPDIPEGDTLR
jgi:antitoxin component YwqK of YwqJK toxin-antitoxin module